MLDWYPLSFDSTGTPTFPDQIAGPNGIAAALTGQPDNPVTDLWILSYGWNTSIPDGDTFYKTWVDLLRSQIQQSNVPTHPMFIGIYWPSEILTDTTSKPNSALGARADFIQAHRPIFDPELKQDDAMFAQDFGGVYDFIATPNLTNQQVSAFLATLKKYQQEDPHIDQPLADNVIETGTDALATMLTTGLNTIFPQAIGNGLLDFLRVFSFWTMKGRAGIVGAQGLAPFLATFRANTAQNNPTLSIHLMGHSFGAKLLTAAVFETASLPDAPQPVVDTLILFEDPQLYNVKLPWPGIDQNTLNTVSCINLNRTPFFDQALNDPLIGIHNDYREPEIFQAAVAISQLNQGKP